MFPLFLADGNTLALPQAYTAFLTLYLKSVCMRVGDSTVAALTPIPTKSLEAVAWT